MNSLLKSQKRFLELRSVHPEAPRQREQSKVIRAATGSRGSRGSRLKGVTGGAGEETHATSQMGFTVEATTAAIGAGQEPLEDVVHA